MTRAGEKLYRERDEPHGSVLWALVTHPVFRRGFRDLFRWSLLAVLVTVLFGLG